MAYYFSNKQGIPNIESQSVSVGTDAITFNFNPHSQLGAWFQGLIVVKISQSFPTQANPLPIKFATIGFSDSAKNLVAHETNVTTGDWPGQGIYLCFYDRATDKLQLITTSI